MQNNLNQQMQILGAAVNLKLAVVKGSTQVYLG